MQLTTCRETHTTHAGTLRRFQLRLSQISMSPLARAMAMAVASAVAAPLVTSVGDHPTKRPRCTATLGPHGPFAACGGGACCRPRDGCRCCCGGPGGTPAAPVCLRRGRGGLSGRWRSGRCAIGVARCAAKPGSGICMNSASIMRNWVCWSALTRLRPMLTGGDVENARVTGRSGTAGGSVVAAASVRYLLCKRTTRASSAATFPAHASHIANPSLVGRFRGLPANRSNRDGIMKVAQLARRFASAAAGLPDRKVAILGAAGGIGQPLGLLMKVILLDDAEPGPPLVPLHLMLS